MPHTRRIGVTMRVVRSDHGETRDALARDWPVLFERLGRLGGYAPDWLMLPNTGEACVAFARRQGVRGLLLTGGDDLGATPDRDATETALLRWAEQEGLPVLGVCRGAQLLACRAGAELVPLARERHVAARHAVVWQAADVRAGGLPREGGGEVNSYHAWGLEAARLPACLIPQAICPEDGSVEAFAHAVLPWRGILWHPEREAAPAPRDLPLMQGLFTLN
ncbi:gamma-glutamyl-gamma-aminobutyrate hydrolase family protein [uncultured Desulfovibrio sp.]|uniref:gamma-glutamyl-gamma-aminobutyrate hydrolase family protein n=1 Tax=uncultured Desulfovibrio sp. TaxID=167968 RepID=UPI0025E7CFAD|nr:gamma-glutamyl-gamma-aminobutyrate hydrolase family protein [uncultured Desulfovibrio sp.]